jgi:hypothetical protein
VWCSILMNQLPATTPTIAATATNSGLCHEDTRQRLLHPQHTVLNTSGSDRRVFD